MIIFKIQPLNITWAFTICYIFSWSYLPNLGNVLKFFIWILYFFGWFHYAWLNNSILINFTIHKSSSLFFFLLRQPNNHRMIISLGARIQMIILFFFIVWIRFCLTIFTHSVTIFPSYFFHLASLFMIVHPLFLKRTWFIICMVGETHVAWYLLFYAKKFGLRKHMKFKRFGVIEPVFYFSLLACLQA